MPYKLFYIFPKWAFKYSTLTIPVMLLHWIWNVHAFLLLCLLKRVMPLHAYNEMVNLKKHIHTSFVECIRTTDTLKYIGLNQTHFSLKVNSYTVILIRYGKKCLNNLDYDVQCLGRNWLVNLQIKVLCLKFYKLLNITEMRQRVISNPLVIHLNRHIHAIKKYL